MGLQLYRRHRKACEAKRPEDSTTGKFEEGRRQLEEVLLPDLCLGHARRKIQTPMERRTGNGTELRMSLTGWQKDGI